MQEKAPEMDDKHINLAVGKASVRPDIYIRYFSLLIECHIRHKTHFSEIRRHVSIMFPMFDNLHYCNTVPELNTNNVSS